MPGNFQRRVQASKRAETQRLRYKRKMRRLARAAGDTCSSTTSDDETPPRITQPVPPDTRPAGDCSISRTDDDTRGQQVAVSHTTPQSPSYSSAPSCPATPTSRSSASRGDCSENEEVSGASDLDGTDTPAAGNDNAPPAPTDDPHEQPADVSERARDCLRDYLIHMAAHKVSKRAIESSYAFFKSSIDILASAKMDGCLPGFADMWSDVATKVPKIFMDFAHLNTETNKVVEEHRLTEYPRKKYSDQKYSALYSVTYMNVRDIMEFHARRHSCAVPNKPMVVLHNDGFPEANTSHATTVDMVSMSFIGCTTVYPVRVLRPIVPAASPHLKPIRMKLLWQAVVEQLNECNADVIHIMGDAPKRATYIGKVQHNGTYPCDVCVAKTVAVDVDKPQGGRKVRVLPYDTTATAELRSSEQSIEIAAKIAAGDLTVGEEDAIGFTSLSPLWALKNHRAPGTPFDLVNRVPVDAMHAVALGVTKSMFEMTCTMDKTSQSTNSTERPFTVLQFTNHLRTVKVPSEFSRRTGVWDFAKSTAEQFLHICLFYYIIILEIMPQASLRREVWAMYCFGIRAFTLPDEEFQHVHMPAGWQAFWRHFVYLHEKIFGKRYSSYNLHLQLHWPRMRELHGPLLKATAFANEKYYGFYKAHTQPGTPSPPKQGMRGTYVAYLKNHTCRRRKIAYSDKVTSRTDDSLVYKFDNGKYTFFKLVSRHGGDAWIANEFSVVPYQTDIDYPGQDNRSLQVGIAKVVENCETRCFLRDSEITGKAIRVGEVAIMSVPMDVLVNI